MLCRGTKRMLFVVALLLSSFQTADADDLDQVAKALQVISNSANSICDSIEPGGHTTDIVLEGVARAEVSRLVKQLADLKIEGTGKFGHSGYEWLPQKDLAAAMKDSRQCKLKIFELLKDRLLPKPVSQLDIRSKRLPC